MSGASSVLRKFISPYRIVHRMPGRIRIHIPLLEKVPPNWHAYSEIVADVIKIKNGIQKVEIQPISGRILIIYEPKVIGENEIKHWLNTLTKMVMSLSQINRDLTEEEFIPLLDHVRLKLLSFAN